MIAAITGTLPYSLLPIAFAVATQRRNYRIYYSGTDTASGMTPERVRLLEEEGFEWSTTDPRHEPWENRFEELKQFVVSLSPGILPYETAVWVLLLNSYDWLTGFWHYSSLGLSHH